MSALGLLAGAGRLPLEIARAARRRGRKTAVFAFEGLADPELEAEASFFEWRRLGEFQAAFDFFNQSGATQLVMAGKTPKSALQGGVPFKPDAVALALLARLTKSSDDALLGAIAGAFEDAGFEVLEQLAFTPELRAPAGLLCGPAPNAAERALIATGFCQARAHGASGTGQTVVVGEGGVYARERAEHTDETIARGCARAAGGTVCVVKVMRAGQDPRFDLPTVGPDTIRAMAAGGAQILAVEAEVTVLIERETLLAEAEAAGVRVLCVDEATIAAWSRGS